MSQQGDMDIENELNIEVYLAQFIFMLAMLYIFASMAKCITHLKPLVKFEDLSAGLQSKIKDVCGDLRHQSIESVKNVLNNKISLLQIAEVQLINISNARNPHRMYSPPRLHEQNNAQVAIDITRQIPLSLT